MKEAIGPISQRGNVWHLLRTATLRLIECTTSGGESLREREREREGQVVQVISGSDFRAGDTSDGGLRWGYQVALELPACLHQSCGGLRVFELGVDPICTGDGCLVCYPVHCSTCSPDMSVLLQVQQIDRVVEVVDEAVKGVKQAGGIRKQSLSCD
ncbi:hypothetical protein JZ751_026084 [Albula glossodonta]|uniref:Uncharacterized protein n=1 Tax=Albula glossodonta TaxID=121402 RepID=A0A8T2NDC0_9TELE|nr:hypothetical protein JZ751_026084 [Albula glossodonta]